LLSPGSALIFGRFALALTFLWFGAMNFTAVGTGIVSGWLEGHVLLSGLSDQASSAARAMGVYQIVMAALIGAPIPSGSFRRIGFAMLGLYAAGALTLIFTNPVWAEAEGGFPAIGAGQGIIKYLAILGLALWASSFDNSRMFSNRYSQMRIWAQLVMWAGLVLVFGWIGAMKFTATEAAGIAPLAASHLAFYRLPDLVGQQGTSYLIGAIELFTVAALAGYWFSTRAYRLGLVMAAVTCLFTLSFLITYQGAWQDDLGGFPALSQAGHFLLKDLPLLAACLALLAETGREGSRYRR